MEHDDQRNPAPAPTGAGVPALPPGAEAPPDYNLADYRWVPVRRRPRYDGWTEEKQRRFIEVLAHTGLVGLAAKAVGMSRESAYRLRSSPHGAAFARAWDAARLHAAGLLEDIAFERAIEGVEHEVYNDCGEVIGAKLVHDNRLLKWLLGCLKPERYGTAARAGDAPAPQPAAEPPTLENSLRAMEPALPAPPEQLLTPDELADELELADVADGKLPQFLAEQRPIKTEAQVTADENAARRARGEAAYAKGQAGQKLTDEELADECFYLDPAANARRRRQPR